MKKGIFLVFLSFPLLLRSQDLSGLEKDTLIQIIYILIFLLILVFGREVYRYSQKHHIRPFSRIFNKSLLEIELEKDKLYRPQVLTMTIRNLGKNEVEFHAPVLEFRKIWSKRKFKLNGISGRQIYPLFLDPDDEHTLRIETANLHQYDKTIKSFYWAQIHVTEINGRIWRSKPVKLRKSLVT
ncbi:MAG: hypothetical protein WAO52_13805 [Prolixibacteraceae bacterium]